MTILSPQELENPTYTFCYLFVVSCHLFVIFLAFFYLFLLKLVCLRSEEAKR